MLAGDSNAARLQAMADELADAERDGVGIAPFSQRVDAPNELEAWEIARLRDEIRTARGAKLTGYKLGWTSAAMRKAMGIESPNFGRLFDYMHVGDGNLSTALLIHPKAEPEFAYLPDAPLSGPDTTDDEVMASGRWALALEVVDPRWHSYDFTWTDNTADGSSAARYALGEFKHTPVAPEELRLVFRSGDGQVEGRGAAVLGSPARAVSFLVSELHRRDLQLEPGLVVLTGGVTAPVDLRPGLALQVTSPDLPGCRLQCQ